MKAAKQLKKKLDSGEKLTSYELEIVDMIVEFVEMRGEGWDV